MAAGLMPILSLTVLLSTPAALALTLSPAHASTLAPRPRCALTRSATATASSPPHTSALAPRPRPAVTLSAAAAASSLTLSPTPRCAVALSAAATASSVPADAEPILAVLKEAAETKAVADEEVVGALIDLEQTMRQSAKDDPSLSMATLRALDGAWRLVFTTGTVDTQKRIGSVNYFPIKAVQTFDTSNMKITNGIFVGDFALLKFFGDFEWEEKKRRLNFDFDAIAVLGFKIELPKGGAAKIGASTGLGSESNVKLAENKKKPFFNWISADESVATARGGGGGLALWRRDLDMQSAMPRDP